MTLFYPETPIHRAMWGSIEAAAPRLSVEVTPAAVHNAAEIESAISSFALNNHGGIIVLPHAVTWQTKLSSSHLECSIACLRFMPPLAL